RPVQVEIAHGSGYLVLDRSAREQVLAHWRFRPAIVNGHAVRAWASVPVSFVLNNL
ncbi:MAG: TonB family protein, partial [Xanthomonadaceae bacterium]|nr:TonB family protein [Xanthomonadaceae bacterium]